VAKKGKKDNKKGEKKTEETANTAQDEEFFAFTCTSDFSTVAEALQIPKSKTWCYNRQRRKSTILS